MLPCALSDLLVSDVLLFDIKSWRIIDSMSICRSACSSGYEFSDLFRPQPLHLLSLNSANFWDFGMRVGTALQRSRQFTAVAAALQGRCAYYPPPPSAPPFFTWSFKRNRSGNDVSALLSFERPDMRQTSCITQHQIGVRTFCSFTNSVG